MINVLQTGRDPFARQTIRKRAVRGAKLTCAYCGTEPWVHGRKLWQYYIDADSPRQSGDIGKPACGIECLRAYMGA